MARGKDGFSRLYRNPYPKVFTCAVCEIIKFAITICSPNFDDSPSCYCALYRLVKQHTLKFSAAYPIKFQLISHLAKGHCSTFNFLNFYRLQALNADLCYKNNTWVCSCWFVGNIWYTKVSNTKIGFQHLCTRTQSILAYCKGPKSTFDQGPQQKQIRPLSFPSYVDTLCCLHLHLTVKKGNKEQTLVIAYLYFTHLHFLYYSSLVHGGNLTERPAVL